MKIVRVLITGASPDQRNRNTVLRSYVVEGFQQLLGFENVFHSALEHAADIADKCKPDLVLCFGSCMPDDADYFSLKYICAKNGFIMAFWLHDDPYEFDYSFKVCNIADFIFSNDKWASLHYDHDCTFHLPLAASQSVHWRQLQSKREIDIFFCGVGFPNRIRLINDIFPVLEKYKTVVLGDQWPEKTSHIWKNRRLSNDELSNHYAQSNFTLNIGRDFHYANNRYQLVPSTPGPRTFEAAMAGTTQLYFVESLEIEEYYEVNTEIILFNSVDELNDIMQQFADGDLDAHKIREASQMRTLNDHTYFSRAQSLIRMIENGSNNI